MEKLVDVVIEAPSRDFELEAQQFLAVAEAYEIDNDDLYRTAANDLQDIKRRFKAIDAKRREITIPLDAARHAAMEFFRPALTFLERSEAAIKKAMTKYQAEQEKVRLEMERVSQELARKEQARLAKLAEAAQAKGQVERADELRDQAAMLPATTMLQAPPPAPQPKGISITTHWKFRVVDHEAIPREYLAVDMTKIGGVVRAMKGQTRISGIEVFEARNIAARS